MIIKIHFLFPTPISMPVREYDDDLDDIRSILIDVCDFIQPYCQFIVSGFGQACWPVDVATDLSIFLEQLPDALNSLAKHEDILIEFYEQGIERTIAFTPTSSGYLAVCSSNTQWQPIPPSEEIDFKTLKLMLTKIKQEFIGAVGTIAPQLLSNDWLMQWQGSYTLAS